MKQHEQSSHAQKPNDQASSDLLAYRSLIEGANDDILEKIKVHSAAVLIKGQEKTIEDLQFKLNETRTALSNKAETVLVSNLREKNRKLRLKLKQVSECHSCVEVSDDEVASEGEDNSEDTASDKHSISPAEEQGEAEQGDNAPMRNVIKQVLATLTCRAKRVSFIFLAHCSVFRLT